VRQPVTPPGPWPHGETRRVELRIPAEPEWVGVARLAAAGIASRLDFPIEDLEDLKLAVAEACNCCIQNGGDDDLHVGCEIHEDRIIITVERTGAPTTTQRPASGDEMGLGQLGVFIIRALMDEVVYASDASGTRLSLIKRLGK